MVLRLHFGGEVSGEHRFERADLQESFLNALEASAGIKMFGLRRIGKSTLIKFTEEQLILAKKPYIKLNGQGMTSLADFLNALSLVINKDGALWGNVFAKLTGGPAADIFAKWKGGEELEEQVALTRWRYISNTVKESLGEAEKPVLLFDEFSFFIDNLVKAGKHQQAELILAALREWRGMGMKMVLAGSFGFTTIARTSDISLEHNNDMKPVNIPELTPDEARNFIYQATEKPSNGRWTQAHVEEFLNEVGVLYPCFLVSGLKEIGVEKPAAVEEFADIFSERVRPDLHNDFYTQFNKRFKRFKDLPNKWRNKLIVPAMKNIMTADKSVSQDKLSLPKGLTGVDLSEALEMLREDGFISFTEDADGTRYWKPASRLSKLWWKRAGLA